MSNYKKIKGEEIIILQPDEEYESQYDKLEPGIYTLSDVGNPFTGSVIPAFEHVKERDKLVRFKSGIVASVLNEVDRFLSKETKDMYEELRIAHKMGILFYGKQGTGKTSTCYLIMKSLCERYSALCFDATGKRLGFIKTCMRKIRKVQDNPIIIFIDEFDASVRHEEENYLTFLDGGESFDGVVVMGCTNYIENIPDRIKKRKSRIKYNYNINSLPVEVYREYLIDRIPTMDPKIISQFSFLAEEKGLTIDQLKHALIDYKLEKISIEKAIKQARSFDSTDSTKEDNTKDD